MPFLVYPLFILNEKSFPAAFGRMAQCLPQA